MHQDAMKNYSSNQIHGEPPADLSTLSDRQVVLIMWGNTRYRHMTGDNFDYVSPDLNAAWARIASARTNEDWTQLRRDFEANGWYGSPTQAPW